LNGAFTWNESCKLSLENTQDEKGQELSLASRTFNSEGFGSVSREGSFAGEELASTLADSALVMIWTARSDKQCDYFNLSWLNYRGRTIEQEIGPGWLEGVHPEDLAHCLGVRESSFEQRQSFQIEYRLQRHDRVYRWILDSASPRFFPGGAFRGYVGCYIDIHERRLAEDALLDANASLSRQNQELSEFAYGACHDLQEPLRTIESCTQLLARSSQDAHLKVPASLIPAVLGSVQRMQELIGDLLGYSHIIHQSELRLTELDCNEVLDRVLVVCQAAIQQSDAVITHDPLPTVRADEAQLGQVLQNLISNGIKFRRPDKRPRLHIFATVRPDEWLFQVADNGIGFDPQYSERIFGLFKRLHGQATYGGNGIGLAICRKIVERHGVRIWARSEPGHGTRFFFTLRSG